MKALLAATAMLLSLSGIAMAQNYQNDRGEVIYINTVGNCFQLELLKSNGTTVWAAIPYTGLLGLTTNEQTADQAITSVAPRLHQMIDMFYSPGVVGSICDAIPGQVGLVHVFDGYSAGAIQ
jgi:hypothetical protein